ncbi:MAG: hypothetical protein V7K47_10140 [Nostoc sp.]
MSFQLVSQDSTDDVLTCLTFDLLIHCPLYDSKALHNIKGDRLMAYH